MGNFADNLTAAIDDKGSRVCVGLDPRVELLPPPLAKRARRGAEAAADACREFCCNIIEAVDEHAAAVKPQAAFFELLGPAGYSAMWDVIAAGKSRDLTVILDAKRADIGSTSAAYAKAYLQPQSALTAPDAITVNPYFGSDGIQPFIEGAADSGRGIFILAKTSNPSSAELQDLQVNTADGARPVYERIADLVGRWGRELSGDCGYSSIGAVVGATHPRQLQQLRTQLPRTPFLVPGYGAQGGGPEDVAAAFDEDGMGAIVNSSRGIIFAYRGCSDYDGQQYASAAAAAAKQMKADINAVL